MGPIFNEKVTEKWNLWVRKQCKMHCSQLIQSKCAAKVKKKKKNFRKRSLDSAENAESKRPLYICLEAEKM